MEDVTRRKFIQGTTALAASAAVGIPMTGAFREYGPVELKLMFFSRVPTIIQGSVFSDEGKDIFGINAFFYNTREKTGTATMSLTKIRKIVESRSSGIVRVSTKNQGGDTDERDILIGAASKDLTFREQENEAAPFWILMQDVRQVL
jgi:hypothetical protein